jgi:hypothetical protein
MKLDMKYFGKFAMLTDTLGNNAPISDCTRLWRCIQGHLNFHLSSTSITIHGIDNLDAAETLKKAGKWSKDCALLSMGHAILHPHRERDTPFLAAEPTWVRRSRRHHTQHPRG